MRNWLNQHHQAIKHVLVGLAKNKLATLLMCLMMGVTLCLPSVLYVIVDNISQLAQNVQQEPKINVFLKLDSNEEVIAAIKTQLNQNQAIKEYIFTDRDEAWQRLSAENDLAASLGKNPLPDAFFIKPISVNPADIEQLRIHLQAIEGVELAQVDSVWIKRLYGILALGKKAVLVLVVLLGFALLAIIGNTIRLQILTQREEIEVSQLIGATNSFIRRPFLYAGIIYGLLGGILAWLLLIGIINLFNYSVAEIAAQYASDFRLNQLAVTQGLVIILLAMLLGWLGAYTAVGRSLSEIRPLK